MISNTIHGYREGHSCETSILEIIGNVVESQEEGSHFGLCLFDQSAAFNLLDFIILENKMRALNLREGTITWYMNFLRRRKQYVYLEGFKSEEKEIDCGAPQGRSSRPLLWLM